MGHSAVQEAARAEREKAKPAQTVMVAEDYEETRHMLKLALELEGYRVLEADNGRDACEMARRLRPDLIVMDLTLPVLDGFAATRRIREEEGLRDVPIIAITAHGTPEYRHKALAAGCSEYFTKPVDVNRLGRVIKSLLREGGGG